MIVHKSPSIESKRNCWAHTNIGNNCYILQIPSGIASTVQQLQRPTDRQCILILRGRLTVFMCN